ncbi:L-type lectin-domain containing receptor kinase IX.1 [Coffea eugenioides]|uniref:L-type lectin-domain containing receptor kinase IX.1 n=1 Tax=Coffea eugenioides TaxID=49369 RepID=UPI000F606A8C|nr:L-type lectin-domain containing receptor kinase IX.1 [Coffea eugenioides]
MYGGEAVASVVAIEFYNVNYLYRCFDPISHFPFLPLFLTVDAFHRAFHLPLSLPFCNSFLLLLFLILFSCLANAISFQITRFSPDLSTILYRGDAIASVGAIEFNNVDYLYQVGQAIYSQPVPIWDSHSRKVADFTTHFSFTIDTQNRTPYGHGLAFFLAPIVFQIPPNSGGGFLGLFNTSTSDSSQNQIVSIEFDSFANPEWDPPFEHVGINKNSIASSITTPWNASLHSGDTADAWIVYNSSTQNLSVFWNYGSSPNSSLSLKIDLKEILPQWAIIGFSAATGLHVERHTLESWEFSSNLDMTKTSGRKAKEIGLIVGLTAAGAILIAGGVIAIVVLRRKIQSAKWNPQMAANLTSSMNDDFERGTGPKRFSFKDLASATNNFSNERKLGEGGFGKVYKGELIDLNIAVAVKKFSRGSKQGKKQYVTEVKIISSLRHRNLVQLIGWCHDQNEFLLVYEFMPNGSLDTHLFGRKNLLSWSVRYKIAIGLASALLYLHEEWEQCVIHRDIKSSNVMLDSNFNAKLGDFGLARLMDHELGPQTTGVAGTFGYLAPEYVSTGRPSKESDVYSFGVVALEIASGRKSTDPMPTHEKSETGLLEWVWDLYGSGKLSSAMDGRLNNDFDLKQFECLLTVGLWCAHPDRSLRPTIKQAIQALNFEATLPNLPTKMPVPIYDVPNIISSSAEPLITCTSIDVGR